MNIAEFVFHYCFLVMQLLFLIYSPYFKVNSLHSYKFCEIKLVWISFFLYLLTIKKIIVRPLFYCLFHLQSHLFKINIVFLIDTKINLSVCLTNKKRFPTPVIFKQVEQLPGLWIKGSEVIITRPCAFRDTIPLPGCNCRLVVSAMAMTKLVFWSCFNSRNFPVEISLIGMWRSLWR